MALVGYARASTDGQSIEAQVAELRMAGASMIHHEKVSGAVTDRAALKRARTAAQAGDVLVVTRLDRLARSMRDLLNTLDALARKNVGSGLCVTSGPTHPRRTVG